jgi:hypothetical protein
MSFSLSGGAPLRIAAIVGGFVLLGVGYFVLGPGKPKTATTVHQLVRHPHGLQSFAKKGAATKAAPAAAKTTTSAKASTAAKHESAPVTKPKAKTVPKPKPKAQPKPKRLSLVPDLPYDLAAALQKHPVVVATVYNPNANDDKIAVAEASFGAGLAGVGFVALSVFDEDQIGPVTRAIGLVDSPTTLIYQRPGQVIGQLHGFADKETVAQAVANAAPALVAPPRVKPAAEATQAPQAPHPSAPKSTSSGSSNDPGLAIRKAVPAVEAYNADHNGYVGLNTATMRNYDRTIKQVVVVGVSTGTSYCLRSTIGGKSWYKRGPAGRITTTRCTGP